MKVSNILRRPILRDYEIPYLGNSTLSFDKQISIDDILVSIRNNDVILESKKLNKEIIPTLTCTHNYTNSKVPVYQFLSDVGFNDRKNSVGFSWGSLSSIYRFFPRVEYKDIIISKSKWIFENQDLQCLINSKNLSDAIINWRKEYDLPRYIQLKENDNFLVIDFEIIYSVEMFLNVVVRDKWIVLEEFLFAENSPVVNEKGDYFTNEFLLNWYFE